MSELDISCECRSATQGSARKAWLADLCPQTHWYMGDLTQISRKILRLPLTDRGSRTELIAMSLQRHTSPSVGKLSLQEERWLSEPMPIRTVHALVFADTAHIRNTGV